jgi:hypothetical protein
MLKQRGIEMKLTPPANELKNQVGVATETKFELPLSLVLLN